MLLVPSPPMEKKTSLVTDMHSSIDDLLASIEKYPDETFNSYTVTGTWAAREIFCHVAAWDQVFLAMSTAHLNDEPIPPLPDFDAFNAQEVEKRKGMTRKEIIMEVRKNRAHYIDFISGLVPDQLQDTKGFTFTIEGLARDIISHDQYHLNQIENALP